MINHDKKEGRQLCVTFLDLAKAFGAPEQFVDVVDDLFYTGTPTVFQTDARKTGEIPMTLGVKQGDPLSPLLLNIAMDLLVKVIDRQSNGYKFGPKE